MSSSSPSPVAAAVQLDLDGNPIAPLTICMIGAGGFFGSHLCGKLMAETRHIVLAVNVYSDKICQLVDPSLLHLAGRISFYHLNIKNDSRLKGGMAPWNTPPGRPPRAATRPGGRRGWPSHPPASAPRSTAARRRAPRELPWLMLAY